MTKDNVLSVTSASEWKKKRKGVTVELSPGFVVRMRPLSIIDIVTREGTVPDQLTPLLSKLILAGAETDDEKKAQKTVNDILAEEGDDAIGNVRKMALIYDAVAVACIVEPKVVFGTPGADEISVNDLTMEEKQRVFDLANYDAQSLSPFREEYTRDVEPGDDGGTVGPETQ